MLVNAKNTIQKKQTIALDLTYSGFLLLSSGRGPNTAPECVEDDELMDVTERLPVGHCKPQG